MFPRFTGRFDFHDLDVAKYTQHVRDMAQRAIKSAARAWLAAVLSAVDGTFPVWSGMAKSSLVPLSRYLRAGVTVSLGDRKRTYNTGPRHGKSYMIPDRRAEGEALGTTFSFSEDGPQMFTFKWYMKVPHYVKNETDPPWWITHNSPWLTMPAGGSAFKVAMAEYIKKHRPSLRKYLVVRRTKYVQ